MQIGVFTFGETRVDPDTGRQLEAGERIRRIVEEIETADRVGLDVYGVGEHHRPDYSVSSPAMVLAAGAARTERIRLTSAVTVLSSDDPVRVFQDFAILDQISEGRAEIMAGRGSFTESFPLFGQKLDDYDEIFAEKLELLLRLRDLGSGEGAADGGDGEEGDGEDAGTGGRWPERVTWQGTHRPSIDDRGVYPRPYQEPLPVWLAVGGTPGSIVRAGTLGLPIAFAIIGGKPARFAPLVQLYRESARRAGHDPERLPVSINSHGFVAEDADEAGELAYPPFAVTMNRIGRERGWPPTSRAHFEQERRLDGALFVGSPDDVVEKILHQHELFGHDRFMIQLTVGPMPHEKVLGAIELMGEEVAPRVRKAVEGG